MADENAEFDYVFYELTKVVVHKPKQGEFQIANASVGNCGLCSRIITGMGGALNMVCIECGDLLQSGQLRGCVKYDEHG